MFTINVWKLFLLSTLYAIISFFLEFGTVMISFFMDIPDRGAGQGSGMNLFFLSVWIYVFFILCMLVIAIKRSLQKQTNVIVPKKVLLTILILQALMLLLNWVDCNGNSNSSFFIYHLITKMSLCTYESAELGSFWASSLPKFISSLLHITYFVALVRLVKKVSKK